MTPELTAQQQIDKLMGIIKAQEIALQQANKAKSNGHGMKVSEKGALSVYGMGRFPVTLYRSQWTALLAKAPEIEKFIKDNAASLKEKA